MANLGMKRRKFSRTVTRARGLISSQIGEEKPGNEHCSTSSESVVGISRKKNNGNELARRRKGYHHRATSKHKPGLFFPRDFMSSTSASLQSRVGICSSISFFPSKIALFLFSLLMTTAQKRACRKRDQDYSFPAKLLFAYFERRGFSYFIGWRLFVLTYLSDKACHAHKSLEGEN